MAFDLLLVLLVLNRDATSGRKEEVNEREGGREGKRACLSI